MFKRLKDRYKKWIAKQNEKLFGQRCDTCLIVNAKFTPTIECHPRHIDILEGTNIITREDMQYFPEGFFEHGRPSDKYVRLAKKRFIEGMMDRLIERVDWKCNNLYNEDPFERDVTFRFRLFVGRQIEEAEDLF